MAVTHVASRTAKRERSRAKTPVRIKSHTRKPSAAPRSSMINLRADTEIRALIDSAAQVVGQNRTEFMLASAKVRAQEILLSRTHFVLSDEAWDELQETLAAPPIPTKELVALMASKAPWAE